MTVKERLTKAGKSVKKLIQRAKMYGHAAWNMYQNVKAKFFQNKSSGEGRTLYAARILGQADHCEDCVAWEINSQGIVLASAIQKIGASVCKSMCKCTIFYYYKIDGEFVLVQDAT